MSQPKRMTRFMPACALGLWLPALACTSGGSGAAWIACPAQVSVEQRVAAPLGPWEVFEEGGAHPWNSVSFFDGHPSQGASLVPDTEAEQEGKRVATWKFPAPSDRRYWIGCSYGSTSVMLVRPLDRQISSCVATFDRQVQAEGRPTITELQCR
jgi:hypothetical protein